jgi:dolichyl-phosphate-mannose-protein mannosyltransferase
MVETDRESRREPLVGSSFIACSRSLVLATLSVLTAAYSVLIYLQIQRHLWFDELLTYHIAKAPDLERLFYLVKRWDLSPPLSHLLAHISLRLFPGILIATRFPSVVEFYLASLLLYAYSVRKLSAPFAALPILVLWYSPMFQYATEARPYALLALFFCSLLLLWDLAVSTHRRGWLIAGIAISSVGLLSSHVLAPLSLLPFAVAELVRFRERRQPDYPLWAALFLPLVLVIWYVPFFQSYQAIAYYPFAFQAGPLKIASFYWNTFRGVFWCLCAACVAGLIAARGRWGRIHPKWRKPEAALFVTIASVPVLLDFAMMLDRAPFWGRYCITSAIALYFIASLILTLLMRRLPRSGHIAAICTSLLLIVQKIVVPAHLEIVHPAPTNAAVLARVRPDLPIVASSGLTFVEMGQYEGPGLCARLFYLTDRSAAIRFAHATIFEDLGDFRKEFKLPGKVEAYTRFVHDHHKFLVFGSFDYPEDWLLRKLSADGAQIVPLGDFETPYKDKMLFEIHTQTN